MSVASEINRIKSNIADAYTEAEAKGATMPATENSANLAQTVASIPEAVQPTLQSKTVTPTTSQQSVTPDSGYDGLSDVIVNATPLEAKTVTPTSQQQVVTPTAPNIGLSSVTVGAAPTPTLITKQITANGTYTAADDNADGYSDVTVDVVTSSKYIIDMSNDLHNKATDKPNAWLERGQEKSYPGWSATDYIQIPEHFVFTLPGDYTYCFLYKEDKTYIGPLTSQFIAGNKPSNAFYVRFSETTSNINKMTMFPLEAEAECIVPASINTPLNFSAYNISVKSLIDILNALSNRTGQTAYVLTLGATNLNKLTAEQKAIATNKNWTLA